MHDIELELSAVPIAKLVTRAEYHAFIIDEPDTDHWYSAAGGIVRRGTPGADRYLGSEIDLTVTYAIAEWMSLEAGYSHFFAGSFVDDTGGDDDADFGYLMATLKF